MKLSSKQKKTIFKAGGWTFLSITLIGLIGLTYLNAKLPDLKKVKDYRPPLSTVVYADDHRVLGEFHTQRRYLASQDEFPELLSQAFIAAEDENFYSHHGIDPIAIFRAALKNLRAGGIRQGGSTITQQVAKSLLLSPERKLSRKIREAILAFKIERHFSKEEIIWLYLNQIYLGHGAYGVKAAAKAYHGKELDELTIAEMALLAGMPTAPSRDNPFVNMDRALSRRSYVLGRMLGMGAIDKDAYEQAMEEEVVLIHKKGINSTHAPYFVEHIRRYIAEKYGDEVLYQGGLQIYSTASIDLHHAGRDALRWGLREIDKRQGWRGPHRHIAKKELKEIEAAGEWQDEKAADSEAEGVLRALVLNVNNKKGVVDILVNNEKGVIAFPTMRWARQPNPFIRPGDDRISRPSQALKAGDVIDVRPTTIEELGKKLSEDEKKTFAESKLYLLEQEPVVQGAIISLDPNTCAVKTMIGGYDFQKSEFNRAVQAKRQPGSAFKPFIYAAALEKGYTAASMILDAPLVYDDVVTDVIWRPKNYDGKYDGPTIFRSALIKSRNVPTIKILQDIGMDRMIDFVRRLGIKAELARDFSVALGSSVMSPLEVITAYTVFAAGGVRREPHFIRKILDRDGNVLERYSNDDPSMDLLAQIGSLEKEFLAATFQPIASDEEAKDESDDDPDAREEEPEPNAAEETKEKLRVMRPNQVINEEIAFVTTHLLKEVVNFGTGWRVKALRRPSAGKTGTTNDNIDAWFVGYTAELATAVWTGFDEKKPLGVVELGSVAASPIWLKFMQGALDGVPTKDFRVPDGIVFAKIDPESGQLATDKTENPIFEAFREGTEPTEDADSAKQNTTQFFLEE